MDSPCRQIHGGRRGEAWQMRISNRHAAVIRRLRSLPDQVSPEFPGAIRALVEELAQPEDTLRQIVELDRLKGPVRFYALYGLLLRLRREERHSEYEHTIVRYGKHFSKEPYFPTFLAISERNRGDAASLRKAIVYSLQAAADMPDVAGVVHQVAAFTAEYLERRLDPVSKEELAEAERYANKAITLSDGRIAHYHETKARISGIRQEFDSA